MVHLRVHQRNIHLPKIYHGTFSNETFTNRTFSKEQSPRKIHLLNIHHRKFNNGTFTNGIQLIQTFSLSRVKVTFLFVLNHKVLLSNLCVLLFLFSIIRPHVSLFENRQKIAKSLHPTVPVGCCSRPALGQARSIGSAIQGSNPAPNS